jgi:hypothetical protein
MNDKTTIEERLAALHNVLWICSRNQKEGKIYIFTTSERICINQERGALFSQINKDNFPHQIRYYNVNPALEAKVQMTLEKLGKVSWANLIPNPWANE